MRRWDLSRQVREQGSKRALGFRLWVFELQAFAEELEQNLEASSELMALLRAQSPNRVLTASDASHCRTRTRSADRIGASRRRSVRVARRSLNSPSPELRGRRPELLRSRLPPSRQKLRPADGVPCSSPSRAAK